MDAAINEQCKFIQSRISECLRKVEGLSTKLKKSNSRLITISLIASGLATLLAGLTAALGPLAGQGPTAWKFTCGAVAAFTALAGVTTGFHQKFSISERLAKAYACAGRLRSLELSLNLSGKELSAAAKEFEEITAAYPEFVL
jgi:hypothetical protein